MVSRSFCLAKWKQVSIHLQTGHTHSCHHPASHSVPLSELENNPSALHNTEFKKKQRELMLKGERPKECGYCWTMEDIGTGDLMSDRVLKSSWSWAAPYFDEVLKAGSEKNILPSYVEVSFSNVCNFKCSYCSPHSSSKWQEEVTKHGHYKTSESFNNLADLDQVGRLPGATKNAEKYLDAWKKWWPELSSQLRVFRITGGEPLLSKETFRTLEELIANPRPELELGINSNLCVPDKVFERFLTLAQEISDGGKVKLLTVFASIDTLGEQAEYIRFGLDAGQFFRNLERLLQTCPKIKVVIMCTFNALSVFRFKEFLEKVSEIKKRYASCRYPGESRLILDISYLRAPRHQAVPVLGGKFNFLLQEAYDFMAQDKAFTQIEKEKMRRVLAWAQETARATDQDIPRRDLMIFLTEHDRRRGTDFLKTFPELKEFARKNRIRYRFQWDWRPFGWRVLSFLGLSRFFRVRS